MAKNYILKTVLIVSFISGGLYLQAQHDPYYTHFRFNNQAYNPAVAGVKVDNICITALTHFQYRHYDDETFVRGTEIGNNPQVVKNVAPETHNLNINTLLNIDKRGRNKVGIGFTLLDDKVGFMKTTTMKGQVNYKKTLQGNFNFISVGVEVGSTSFGYDDPKFKYIDPGDKNIPITGGNASNLDLGVGIMYHQKTFLNKIQDFWVGAAYNHLNAAKYQFTVTMADNGNRGVDMDFVRYLYLSAGGDYMMANKNWKLEPAILVKYNPKLQIDLSTTALYANSLRCGLAYRSMADAISLIVGYEKWNIQIGYSYDITLSGVRRVSDGTHELFAKYCIPISFPPPPEKIFRLSPRFLGKGAY
ncbi:MAG: type IX secretion system membrane protein PorP/SprF [Bacteroidetes bacterium]|nr:type IX secretion system membrane protein PorP/SprF [Bacteroidota bacterium]